MVLRVTLEIVPFGDEELKREIGRLDIFNKGTTDFKEWAYGVLDLNKEPGLYDTEIFHSREDGAWELVRKVLQAFNPRC